MSLNAKLVVVGGEVKSAEIKLRLPSTIGRGRGATIMLPHPLVSRQHCELFETNGKLMVRDLGSLNGTFVNNERISEAALPPGELLTVGAVTFRAIYDSTDSGSPPEGPAPRMRTGHSRDTDATGTVRSAATPAAEPANPPGEAADFNFELPLTPVDETARPADVAKSAAEQASAKPAADSASKDTVPAPGKSAATKPAPGKPAPAPASQETIPGKDPKTVDFSQWEQESDAKPAGEEDNDFGDFLKSLGKK